MVAAPAGGGGEAAAGPGAHSLCPSPAGNLYAGSRGHKVWAVTDRDGDGRAERVVEIATGLDSPNGVAWRDGALYVAEISRILRYDAIDDHLDHLDHPPAPVVVRDDDPHDAHHGKAWGRPVDVEVAHDAALLVSDDLAGAVYRISYRAPG